MRDRFVRELNKYEKHLIDRFNKGSDYVDRHPDDKKSYKLYLEIIDELKVIEELINYYK